jgi:hypothetical protein
MEMNEFRNLAAEISKQSAEDANYFLLDVSIKCKRKNY